MENSVYIDTNVFIDLLDTTRPFAKESLHAIETMVANGTELYINSDTVTNTFYVLSRQKKYTPDALLGLLKKSVSIFTVVPVETEDVMDTLSLCENKNTAFEDYEDALQYICAKKVDATLILSNDKGFITEGIEVKRADMLNLG